MAKTEEDIIKIPWPGYDKFFDFYNFDSDIFTFKCKNCGKLFKEHKSSNGNFKEHIQFSSFII